MILGYLFGVSVELFDWPTDMRIVVNLVPTGLLLSL